MICIERQPDANPLTTRRRLPIQRWGSTIFIGATLAVLVITQLPEWPYTAEVIIGAPAALPANILQAIPAGDPVAITYPYDTFLNMQPMVWQAEDSFDFRLLGGYAVPTEFDRTLDQCGLDESPADCNNFWRTRAEFPAMGSSMGRPCLSVPLVADTRASCRSMTSAWSSSTAPKSAAVQSWSSSTPPSGLPRFRQASSPAGRLARLASHDSSCHTSSQADPTCERCPVSGTGVLDATAKG